jgi:hypothetical protein
LLCAAQSTPVKLTLEKDVLMTLRLDVSGFQSVSKGATISRYAALRNIEARPERGNSGAP